jgi:hypothetical protein
MFRLHPTRKILSLVLLIIFLSACTLPGADNNGGQDDSANQTAVAQTVQANQTAAAQSEATQEATQDPGNGGTGSGEDKNDDATFISDVTIPDQSYIEKGAAFTKTWRLQNSGDSTWTTAYRLVFERDERMGSPEFVSMPKEVKPGEVVDISVEFTAPDTPGEYRSTWMLQNDQGVKFGVGKDGDLPVFVWIFSVEPNQGGNQGGVSGGANVASATLSIDQAVYSGACPATLNLSWNITTSNAGIVQHTINLVSNTSGFTFFPVETYTANFAGAGSTGFQYLLIISDSVDATARVSANGSNTVLSNLVGFSVNCQ